MQLLAFLKSAIFSQTNPGIYRNPGSEPVLLDLQKLLLLSNPVENHHFSGTDGKTKFKNIEQKRFFTFYVFQLYFLNLLRQPNLFEFS